MAKKRRNSGPDKGKRQKKKTKSEICVFPPFKENEDELITISVGEVLTDTIWLVNNGTTPKKLLHAELSYAKPLRSFSLSMSNSSGNGEAQEKLEGPWTLDPSGSLKINLSCRGLQASLHKAGVLFHFEECNILCPVALMGDDIYSKNSAPTESYKRKPTLPPARGVVPGPLPPPNVRKLLPEYFLPDPKWVNSKIQKLPRLQQELSMRNYEEYFSLLLYLEELQMQVNIRAYDQQNVQMTLVHGGLFSIKVPGLYEKRPSLVYRDAIYARYANTTDVEYQGIIYALHADEIHVEFGQPLYNNYVPTLAFDVRFSFSRINLRRAHYAVSHSTGLNRILFPKSTTEKQCQNEQRHFPPFNSQINHEQAMAVANILEKSGGPPYIVFGPPGTGKTVTLVESILQIFRSNPKALILACAPSNSASDLILERLIGTIQKGDILRLNAYSRPRMDVPSHLLPYCSAQNSDFFTCPNMEELMNYKLIVSTYMSSGLLVAKGVPCGHFSHIFLDEAGQATEPESLVPIANFAMPETVLVLAGDPKQLGPVILSPIAKKFGLENSLLERLTTFPFCNDIYSKHITKLIKNYRSHKDILDLPSRLFYNGDLIPCADHSAYSLCGWDQLPNKNFPLLFFGLEGSNKREGSDPSWFNPQEVSKVMEMVRRLKDFKVSNNEIGIITPYRQQVKKIKNALAAAELSAIKVGSVEQFQGQEKRVIIISTVRTSTAFLNFDWQHDIGFLCNPKRFNVAITRAKALLIIIGNPYVLYKDKHWGSLLSYCIDNKAYMGSPTPKENEDEIRSILAMADLRVYLQYLRS